jgi:hypothetical protein
VLFPQQAQGVLEVHQLRQQVGGVLGVQRLAVQRVVAGSIARRSGADLLVQA